jgi:hypothetical protein
MWPIPAGWGGFVAAIGGGTGGRVALKAMPAGGLAGAGRDRAGWISLEADSALLCSTKTIGGASGQRVHVVNRLIFASGMLQDIGKSHSLINGYQHC